jgi:hypothetical protein
MVHLETGGGASLARRNKGEPMTRVSAFRDLVDEYIRMTMALTMPPSPHGRMIDFCAPINDEQRLAWAAWNAGGSRRKPRDDGGLWRSSLGQERRLERRAKLVWIISAMSDLQRRAVILMRLPLPAVEWDEEQTSYYERVTSVVLSRRDEEKVLDKHGNAVSPIPEWTSQVQMRTALPVAAYVGLIVVSGQRLVYPKLSQVARKMGMLRSDGTPSPRKVSQLIAEGRRAMERRILVEEDEEVFACA